MRQILSYSKNALLRNCCYCLLDEFEKKKIFDFTKRKNVHDALTWCEHVLTKWLPTERIRGTIE